MRIIYKGDKDVLPLLLKEGLQPLELYVLSSQDYSLKISPLVAIHFHYDLSDGRRINLADPGEIGDLSGKELALAVESAKKNGVPKLILHPPNINVFTTNKNEAIKNFCLRLEKVYDPQVDFCLENVCLWINQIYTNEPLFTEPEEFLAILKEIKVPLSLTLDVEHFCATSIMKLFYSKYKSHFQKVHLGLVDYDTVRQEFEEELKEYVQNNDLENVCHQFLLQAIDILGSHVKHVHCSGSDFHQQFYNRSTKTGFPTLGEHLPLGFQGEVEGINVKDRINHQLWIAKLKSLGKELDLVLEISPKEDYDYIAEIKRSRDYLRGLL